MLKIKLPEYYSSFEYINNNYKILNIYEKSIIKQYFTNILYDYFSIPIFYTKFNIIKYYENGYEITISDSNNNPKFYIIIDLDGKIETINKVIEPNLNENEIKMSCFPYEFNDFKLHIINNKLYLNNNIVEMYYLGSKDNVNIPLTNYICHQKDNTYDHIIYDAILRIPEYDINNENKFYKAFLIGRYIQGLNITIALLNDNETNPIMYIGLIENSKCYYSDEYKIKYNKQFILFYHYLKYVKKMVYIENIYLNNNRKILDNTYNKFIKYENQIQNIIYCINEEINNEQFIDDIYILHEKMYELLSNKKYNEALIISKKINNLTLINPDENELKLTTNLINYNTACIYSNIEEIDNAFNELNKIDFNSILITKDDLINDTDLISLHIDKRWNKLLNNYNFL